MCDKYKKLELVEWLLCVCLFLHGLKLCGCQVWVYQTISICLGIWPLNSLILRYEYSTKRDLANGMGA